MLAHNYGFDDSGRIASLYEIAKEKVWNAKKDLDWDLVQGESESPIAASYSPFCGYPAYDQLTDEQRLQVDLKWHAIEMSEILHGEQGALLISSQLVQLLPLLDAKLFSSSQVFDEARHVEFFSRYLAEHVGPIQPPSIELKQLIESALADDRVDVKIITMQIVIESLAMAKFQRLKSSATSTLLQVALDYILKDEARHVSFGVEMMRDRVSQMGIETRIARSNYAMEAVVRLANNLNAPVLVADEFGWDKAELRRHLRAQRIADPSEAKAIFRQLQINLSSIGLLTDDLRQKLSARGLFVEC